MTTMHLENYHAESTVAVIGAGPAGLTAAYQLAKAGIPVDVYEAGAQVGGMARTIELWNQKVDLGPHRFFSRDPRVNRLWLEVIGADYEIVNRLTRIYYRNKFFYYPLKPFDVLFTLGGLEATNCIASYLKEKSLPKRRDGSLEGWVVSQFGRRLYNTFFKSYSEKLWGLSCTQVDEDFAAQRIKTLSLFEAVKHSLWRGKDNPHQTLADRFAYPHGGTGMLYERMAQGIKRYGGRLWLNKPVRRVVTQGQRVTGVELATGAFCPYDQVISTMPLSLLVGQLTQAPQQIVDLAGKLRFRNTILVYLNVLSDRLFPDNWLYIHSPDLKMGRMTNFRNWVPQLYGEEKSSILALEYWCWPYDELWAMDDHMLVALACDEIRQTGLIGDASIGDGTVHRIHRCYPVYEKGYKQVLAPIQQYLETIGGLQVIGRYGSFKYNNQDHSMLMGILAAENILSSRQHNLWGINTDYGIYQEASYIGDNQLVFQYKQAVS